MPVQALTEDDVRERMRKRLTWNYSQKQMADDIGVSEQFISMVLKGERSPSMKIREWLGVSHKPMVRDE